MLNSKSQLYCLGESFPEGENTLIRRGTRRQGGLPVIIKRLRREESLGREAHGFRREYDLLARIDLPGVIKVYDFQEDEDGPFMVMEDIGGQGLDRLLAGAALALPQFWDLACGLAETLAGLHRLGIIHKDVNPHHILYNPQTGAFRLTGFAIAEEVSRRVVTPRPPTALEGTLAYMSPEQTGRTNRSLDFRTDLYSLGATFYALLTGRPPFIADDALGMVHCHIAFAPQPPQEREAMIPGQLSDIVLKLMAKSAEERYQSAEGLQADLSRCRAAWQARGGIEPFPLGMHDMPGHLLIPARLYGREREVGTLLAAFDRVASGGKPELVLVSGYSGIGKSAVVDEFHQALLLRQAMFAEGKFDQYKRDIPYATLAQALHALVRQILGQGEREIAELRQAINEALGPNGRLVTDLVPEFVAFIGAQPPVPEVPPQDARNRFNAVFRALLSVFARQEHPLVLFLDDLQWLDAATLQLLEHLLSPPGVKYLLVIGAYRDNEVGLTHPLRLALDSMRKSGAAIAPVVLGPLAEDDVLRLTADTLHCDDEQVKPLAHLVHEKTDGNPFFVIQFLTALADEGLVIFDRSASCWQWDLGRIRGKGFTDNVVDLMIGKLNRLRAETREGLQLLACLGCRTSLATLASVRDKTESEVENTLAEAIQAGFLLQRGEEVSFLHDRIQEAAYALIPEEKRPEQHLSIGRRLLAQAGAALGEMLFDVVNHLNRGSGLITAPAEKERLAELNVAAGKRARAAIAYGTAREYFAAAAALLPEKAWESRYDFLFPLYLAWAEAEFLQGSFEEAERLADLLLDRAGTTLDKVEVYGLRLNIYPLAGRYDDAVAMAIEALKLLGVALPEDDASLSVAIAAERAELEEKLHSRTIADLVRAPEATDPHARAVIRVLTDMGGPVYIGSRPQLYPLTPLKALNYSLAYGFTRETSNSFSGYAFMAVSIFGKPRDGYAFSELAIELSRRYDHPGTTGAILYLHGNHVNFWLKPFTTDFPILEQGFRKCLDAGNLVFANYIAYSLVWQAIERGDTLPAVLEFSAPYAEFALSSRNKAIYQSIVLEQQFIKCLTGRSDGVGAFSDREVDERDCVSAIAAASFTCGIAYYHIMKSMAAYLLDDDAAAQRHAREAEKVLAAVLAQPMEATFTFLYALVLIRVYRQAPAEERGEIPESVAALLQKLAYWAANCPENFIAKHALVAAEIAALQGDEPAAGRLFEQAIDSARENGFSHWEAMANEAAARFYAGRGIRTASHAYWREARSGYARWGAEAKVRQLEASQPWLAAAASAGFGNAVARPEQLDVLSVIKAQQAISEEIRLDDLARTLLRIVMENAGARSGYLAVQGNGHLRAEMTSDDEGVRIDFNASPQDADIPESIVNFVRRSRETVLLSDATKDAGGFAANPYLVRVRPRSLLCLAIERKEELLAVLYLENDLVAGAFTSERRLVLDMLAAQAAISLETAGVYGTLHENEERLRLTLECTRIGTWDWDVEHDIWTASPVYYTMLGYEPKEGPGDREEWMARLHPDDSALFIEKMVDVLSTKQFDNYQYEARLRHADGTYRWQFVKGFGIKRDKEGKVTRMLGIRMDIHDRKLAEEEIKLLSLALDHVREGAFLIDDRGKFHYVNQEACRSLEYAKEELIGMGVRDIDPYSPPEKLEENVSEVFKEGAIIFETKHRTRSGRVFPVEISSSLVEYGGVRYTLALVRDITERKQAEEERLQHLCFFENMDRIHRAMQGESALEIRLGEALEVVLSIFGCDRAYLHFPCDPNANAWRVPVERFRPAYPPVVALDQDQPMDESLAGLLRLLLATDGPVQGDPGTPYPLHDEITTRYNFKSFMAVAVYPGVGPPWVLGIHQCSETRRWTAEEERLLQEIGRRLADGMTSLLMYRDLQKSDAGLRRLKDELEQRVKVRTAELRKNNEELERMNNLFVGRELRMIELKKKIQELEDRLAKISG